MSQCNFHLINRSDLVLSLGEVTKHSTATYWSDHQKAPQNGRFYFTVSGHSGHPKALLNFVDQSNNIVFQVDFSWAGWTDKDHFDLYENFSSPRYRVTLRYLRGDELNDGMPPQSVFDHISDTAGTQEIPSRSTIDEPDIGILIYVDLLPATISKSLKVLTYNTHLFDGSPAADYKPSLVQRDDERCNAIIAKALESNVDIICLQEVWSEKFQQRIIEKLKGSHPYTYVPPDMRTQTQTGESWPDSGFTIDLAQLEKIIKSLEDIDIGKDRLSRLIDIIRSQDSDRLKEWLADTYNALGEEVRDSFMTIVASIVCSIKVLGNSSGLLIASRVPLWKYEFKSYSHLTDNEDLMAKKGFVTFSAILTNGSGVSFDLQIATTHAPTRFDEAKNAVNEVVGKLNARPNTDWIILGDLNIHYYGDQKKLRPDLDYNRYQELSGLLPKAKDVITIDLAAIEDCYTDWQAGNSLMALIDWTGDTKARIDYVYYQHNSSQIPFLKHKKTTIPRNWQIPGEFTTGEGDQIKTWKNGLDLSDHWPVIVEFDIVQ